VRSIAGNVDPMSVTRYDLTCSITGYIFFSLENRIKKNTTLSEQFQTRYHENLVLMDEIRRQKWMKDRQCNRAEKRTNNYLYYYTEN